MLSLSYRPVILVFLTAGLLSACSTTPHSLDKQLAKQGLAELQNTGVTYGSVSIEGRNNANLLKVDGATIDQARGNHDVRAGTHTLTLELSCAHDARSPQLHNDGTIRVHLVAGHTYELNSHLGTDTAKTQQRCVGGIHDLTSKQAGPQESASNPPVSTVPVSAVDETRAAAPEQPRLEAPGPNAPTSAVAGQGFWQTPAVQGYGEVHPLPHAAYQPDPDAVYNIMFVLTRGSRDPSQVNWGLARVATAVNLYVNAGVPLDHLKFVAVATGTATAISLDNAHYQQEYHVANPNLQLIEALHEDGVDILVGGQAVARHHYEQDWINPHISVALGALPVITELAQKGYTRVQF